MRLFVNRSLLIATKHGKEDIMQPLLERYLGVVVSQKNKFDTDTLGTFSGEIPRTLVPLEALREKCNQAYLLHGIDLVVATEGSFGPHPHYFFVPAHEEFVMLKDFKNDWEVTVKVLKMETNFKQESITFEDELLAFCDCVQFPSHAIILRPFQNKSEGIIKGIKDRKRALNAFNFLMKEYGHVVVETDMRAHMNPTRMRIIGEATQQLIDKCHSYCPSCGWPGYDVVSHESGLPCQLCKTPTASTMKWIYVCQKCQHQSEKYYPNGKYFEDPMYCSTCNP